MTEAFVAFIAALGWTMFVALDIGRVAPPAALLALFGCASVALLPAAFVWRHARPEGPESRGTLHGAMLAAVPLAAFGALLFERTHHRALGGVTYAIVAAGVVTAGALLGRRILGISRWGKAPSLALAAAANLSVLSVALWLLFATPGPRAVVSDFLSGAVVLSIAAVTPLERLPRWTRHAALAGFVAAAGGVVLFALNQDLRRHLAEAAPVATFVVRVILL
jgi:hypothetical protein